MEFFDEINELWGIHLSKLEEPKANEIILNIDEAPVGKEYRLYFETYVSYCVINEVYNKINDSYEKWVGKLFCVLSKSHYLDYVRKDTRAEGADIIERTLTHYAFYCLDHTIHIATFDEPIVTKVK